MKARLSRAQKPNQTNSNGFLLGSGKAVSELPEHESKSWAAAEALSGYNYASQGQWVVATRWVGLGHFYFSRS